MIAVNGASEVCLAGQTGILVPPRNMARLTESTGSAWPGPRFAGAHGSARGRDFVRQSFSVETMVEKICTLYRQLAGVPAKVNQPILYFFALLASAVASAVALPFWRRYCRKHGVVDDPGHRKIHATPIPLAGGPAMMTGLVISLLGGRSMCSFIPDSGVMGLFSIRRRATRHPTFLALPLERWACC